MRFASFNLLISLELVRDNMTKLCNRSAMWSNQLFTSDEVYVKVFTLDDWKTTWFKSKLYTFFGLAFIASYIVAISPSFSSSLHMSSFFRLCSDLILLISWSSLIWVVHQHNMLLPVNTFMILTKCEQYQTQLFQIFVNYIWNHLKSLQ